MRDKRRGSKPEVRREKQRVFVLDDIQGSLQSREEETELELRLRRRPSTRIYSTQGEHSRNIWNMRKEHLKERGAFPVSRPPGLLPVTLGTIKMSRDVGGKRALLPPFFPASVSLSAQSLERMVNTLSFQVRTPTQLGVISFPNNCSSEWQWVVALHFFVFIYLFIFISNLIEPPIQVVQQPGPTSLRNRRRLIISCVHRGR
jgi:hypothetical protein